MEIFSLINRFASRGHATVTLLHVMARHAESGGTAETPGGQARELLRRLGARFLVRTLSVRESVRSGEVSEEILAEAREAGAQWIILTSHAAAKQGPHGILLHTVDKVMRRAPCDVTLLHVRSQFNCREHWPIVDDVAAALDYVGLLRPPTDLGPF